ncbi:MAG: hypothetical protein ACTH56_07970 [Pseudoalteromonas sp.]
MSLNEVSTNDGSDHIISMLILRGAYRILSDAKQELAVAEKTR